jgi:hypothetical protein
MICVARIIPGLTCNVPAMVIRTTTARSRRLYHTLVKVICVAWNTLGLTSNLPTTAIYATMKRSQPSHHNLIKEIRTAMRQLRPSINVSWPNQFASHVRVSRTVIWVRRAFHSGIQQLYIYKSYTSLEPTFIHPGSSSHVRV